ncbi:UNVERIFIED_CONTAM: hypothetical protein PYX00_010155 [Menopon gallinae]|uniref:Uncharacterized protein n=1 Tax=Menopon gallinae TaxID=328185 RepID=A0AAW2HE83_9NEOP
MVGSVVRYGGIVSRKKDWTDNGTMTQRNGSTDATPFLWIDAGASDVRSSVLTAAVDAAATDENYYDIGEQQKNISALKLRFGEQVLFPAKRIGPTIAQRKRSDSGEIDKTFHAVAADLRSAEKD